LGEVKILSGAPANAGTNSVGVQSEGEAEGGCGGNSASPARAEVHQQADKLRSRRPARSEQSPAKMLQFKINHVELFKE